MFQSTGGSVLSAGGEGPPVDASYDAPLRRGKPAMRYFHDLG
ncbi:MAG TPA: hypothetical protein VI685_11105 [Candidatus Angelobacter sp.]